MAAISALYIYPIKSCGGVAVDDWPVAARGFFADRRWMVVDHTGRFVTQREQPKLARCKVRLLGAELGLDAPGLSALTLPLSHEAGDARSVRVWRDEAVGVVHPQGSTWFSELLGGDHQLVYMPDRHRRRVNPDRAREDDIVSFADGYPFLIISEASLRDLNARLATPVSMARFRPNIVIDGTHPYAEDDYARVRLGKITFRGPKRCDRCVITTLDPETGMSGKEPLRTLASYRLAEQKVWFGMNLIHDTLGVLSVGDDVEQL